MFMESHRGHFSAVSGCGSFASLALSVIEPDLIRPGLPPPSTGGGGGTSGGN